MVKTFDNFKGKLKMVFVGDIMQHKSQIKYFQKHGKCFENMFSEVDFIFKDADFVLGNFETTLAGEGKLVWENGFLKLSSEDGFPSVLKQINVSHLSVFNNHTLDFGVSVFNRTKQILKKDFKVLNTKTFETINGYTIELYNYCTFVNKNKSYESEKDFETKKNIILNDKLKVLNPNTDIKIAFVHWCHPSAEWGGEYSRKVHQKQKDMALDLLERGYNFVIGSGSHTFQPTEIINKDKLVCYSLGDFIAAHESEEASDDGKILCLEFWNGKLWKVYEYLIDIVTTKEGATTLKIKQQKTLI